MIEKVIEFSINQTEPLSNLMTNEHLIINHVVIKAGESFPAHATEHDIFIIIVKGQMDIHLDQQSKHSYNAGKMISVPKGVVSGISNSTDINTELFVVKTVK